jgi:hypothetical protein
MESEPWPKRRAGFGAQIGFFTVKYILSMLAQDQCLGVWVSGMWFKQFGK